MKQDNFLLSIAVIAVIISIVGVYVTAGSTSMMNGLITGKVTQNGISETLSINIVSAGSRIGSKTIDWGEGWTASSEDFSLLSTDATIEAVNTWRRIDEGMIVENVGDKDIVLYIHADKSARDFISGDNPSLKYKISNIESESCKFNANSDSYQELTAIPKKICQVFHNSGKNNRIKIDFQLKVPADAKIGVQTNPIILTYEII